MKHLIFILTLICMVLTTKAQVGISGKIADKTKSKILEDVTIQLLNLKDSSNISAKSNDKGEFSFAKLNQGKYKLISTLIGFKANVMEIQYDGKPLNLSIEMEPGEIMLEEIAITAAPAVSVKGDTMEFNAKNFKTREYADADEMVAQVPGVTIDEEGNVEAHGEKVSRIIVDGKEFFSTDPKVALKTLPADIIDKLQIIDEKSEQSRFSGFDDGKRSKVINIVTKPDKRKGYFGKANAGKGDADKFAVSTTVNSFSGDRKMSFNFLANNINETNFAEQGRGGMRRGNNNTERGLSDTYAAAFNYTNTFLEKKLEVNGSYNFRNSSTFTDLLSNVEYISGNREDQFQNSTNKSTQGNIEHNLSGRIKWEIDSMNHLDFNPNFSYTTNERINYSLSKMTKGLTDMINNSDRNSRNNNDNLNLGAGFTYMHRFKRKGQTASVNFNGNKSSNEALGKSLALIEYYKKAVFDRIDTNDRENVTNGYGNGFNTRVSLTQNVSNNSRLQANYGFRNTSNYSDRQTLEFLAATGQYEELDKSLSNEFRNDFNHHSAGFSYSYNKHDTLRIQVGMNYEHGIRVNNRTVPYDLKTTADFNSFLPEFTAMYFFTKERNIEFNYNTATNTPSIEQLQDYLDDSNPLNISNGNPYLNQEYSHNLRLQYRDVNRLNGRSLTTNFNVNFINQKIINSIFTSDSSVMLFEDVKLEGGGQYVVPMNMDGIYNARLSNSYGLPLKKLGFNLNMNTNLFLNRNFAYLNDILIPNYSYGFNQHVGIFTNFSTKIILGLNYNIGINFTDNPTSRVQHYSVKNQRLSHSLNLELFKHMVLSYNFAFIQNGGVMGAESINTTLLNGSIGYKIFKKRNAEISIKGFDLLNNATNINRNVSETAISNITSNTLNRYFMVNLTYNLRSFGGRGSGGPEGGERRGGDRPGRPPGGFGGF